MTDLYETLGVDREADAATIRRAYRKKAKSAHPDARGGSREKFDEVSKALAVLSDPVRRRKYDKTGDTTEPERNETETRAYELIAHGISAIVSKADPLDSYIDIIATIRQETQAHVDEVHASVKKMKGFLKRLERLRGRFSRKAKDEKPNVFEDIIRSQIRQIEDANRINLEGLAPYERVLAMLDEYEFRSEVPPSRLDLQKAAYDQHRHHWSFFNTTTT